MSATDRPEVLPEWAKVAPADLRRLSQVDDLTSMRSIAGDWGAILAAAALCSWLWHPALYVVTVLFIGARQHDLLVLMHDAAHFRLMKNRARNDWVSELFLTWPFVVVSTHGYRANHWAHHRHLNTTADPDLMGKTGPDWTFPMPSARMTQMVFTDTLGMAQIRVLPIARRMRKPEAVPERFRRAKAVWLVAMLIGISLAGIWLPVLLYWVVPFFTWTPAVLRLRAVAEHYGIHAALPVGTRSRTVLPTLLDRLFFVRHPVWFHAEHHFHPSVPLHRLAELHELLMTREAYRSRAHVTHGYLSAFREVTLEGWRGPTEPLPGAVEGHSL